MIAAEITDLRSHIAEIACAILGVPNTRLSTRQQLRFGTNGSVAVEIAGDKRGQWFDHEAGIGGGPWELLTIKGRMINDDAIGWLKSQLGIEITPRVQTSRRMAASYDYRDESAIFCSRCVGSSPKISGSGDRTARAAGSGRRGLGRFPIACLS